MHRLARVRQAEGEQRTLRHDPSELHVDVAEVDFRLDARPVRLRDEHLGRPPSLLHADLRAAAGHVLAHQRVRNALHAELIDQPVIDPLHGVPLLARCVQIRLQHPVDHGLERVQPRGTGGGLRRGAGHADVSASRTVLRCTSYFRPGPGSTALRSASPAGWPRKDRLSASVASAPPHRWKHIDTPTARGPVGPKLPHIALPARPVEPALATKRGQPTLSKPPVGSMAAAEHTPDLFPARSWPTPAGPQTSPTPNSAERHQELTEPGKRWPAAGLAAATTAAGAWAVAPRGQVGRVGSIGSIIEDASRQRGGHASAFTRYKCQTIFPCDTRPGRPGPAPARTRSIPEGRA
jgi:hypothetical protein